MNIQLGSVAFLIANTHNPSFQQKEWNILNGSETNKIIVRFWIAKEATLGRNGVSKHESASHTCK